MMLVATTQTVIRKSKLNCCYVLKRNGRWTWSPLESSIMQDIILDTQASKHPVKLTTSDSNKYWVLMIVYSLL